VSQGRRAGLLERLRSRRAGTDAGSRAPALPDPAEVPRNRGSWEQAALTNVDITELVKRQIRTRTQPWQK
jgi:hypothetical protein